MKRKALISSRHRITTRCLSEYFLLRISRLQLRLFIYIPLVGWLEQGGWPWVDHSRSLYRSTATLLGHARASMSDTNEIFLLHSLLLADFTTIVVSICSTEQSLTRTQDYPINKLGQGVKKKFAVFGDHPRNLRGQRRLYRVVDYKSRWIWLTLY